jgi:hypothetical protein
MGRGVQAKDSGLTLTRRTLHWLHPRRLFAWLLRIGMTDRQAEKDRAELRPQVGGFGRDAHVGRIRSRYERLVFP